MEGGMWEERERDVGGQREGCGRTEGGMWEDRGRDVGGETE